MNFLTFIISALALLSCLGVVVFRNPLHSTLCLIANFCLVAVLYGLISAYFLAAAQVIVYTGAIAVLVVFVLMLLETKFEPLSKKDYAVTLGGFAVGILSILVLVPFVWRGTRVLLDGVSSEAQLGSHVEGTAKILGQKLFSEYLLLFQLSGIVLMIALFAALMLIGVKREANK